MKSLGYIGEVLVKVIVHPAGEFGVDGVIVNEGATAFSTFYAQAVPGIVVPVHVSVDDTAKELMNVATPIFPNVPAEVGVWMFVHVIVCYLIDGYDNNDTVHL